jgi:hypothetical protein
LCAVLLISAFGFGVERGFRDTIGNGNWGRILFGVGTAITRMDHGGYGYALSTIIETVLTYGGLTDIRGSGGDDLGFAAYVRLSFLSCRSLGKPANLVGGMHPGRSASEFCRSTNVPDVMQPVVIFFSAAYLAVPKKLRRSLACTNIIENAMSTVRRVCQNVKRWRSASMAMRWAAAAMQEAARGFRRLKAHKQLPTLRVALEAHHNKDSHGVKPSPLNINLGSDRFSMFNKKAGHPADPDQIANPYKAARWWRWCGGKRILVSWRKRPAGSRRRPIPRNGCGPTTIRTIVGAVIRKLNK